MDAKTLLLYAVASRNHVLILKDRSKLITDSDCATRDLSVGPAHKGLASCAATLLPHLGVGGTGGSHSISGLAVVVQCRCTPS